jgi:hypothetical protein
LETKGVFGFQIPPITTEGILHSIEPNGTKLNFPQIFSTQRILFTLEIPPITPEGNLFWVR